MRVTKVSDPEFLRLTHMDTDVVFGHLNDERAFFEWLARIPCVERYFGDGPRGLVVQLTRRPGRTNCENCLRYATDIALACGSSPNSRQREIGLGSAIR